MASRRNASATALLVAVIACAPIIVRCGSDSGGRATGGSGGSSGDQAGISGAAGSGRGGSSSTSGGSGGALSGGASGAAVAGAGGDDGQIGIGLDALASGGEAGSDGSGARLGGFGGDDLSSGASGSGSAARDGLGGAGATTSGAGGDGSPGTDALEVSTDSLTFSVVCPDPLVPATQTFAVTNVGNAAFTWTAVFDSSKVSVTPAGGTLTAGAHADVTVGVLSVGSESPSFNPFPVGDIGITGDVPEETRTVSIAEEVFGYFAAPQADIDFGQVHVTDFNTRVIASNISDVPGALLGSDNPDFHLAGMIPSTGGWLLTFEPQKAGPQTATLQFGSLFGACIWPPKSFKATGIGILVAD